MLDYRLYDPEIDDEGLLELEIREIEAYEARVSTGKDHPETLFASIECSDIVWVILHNERICGVFGLATANVEGKTLGIPWMVTDETPFLPVYRIKFLKTAKKIVAAMECHADMLYNMVSKQNKESIRFLTWLGFEFDLDPISFSRDPKFEFIRFYKEVKS